MANTPIGFEITNFLDEVALQGESNPQYNAFVRRFEANRKKVIRKERALERNALRTESRLITLRRISLVLTVMAWICFCAIFLLGAIGAKRATGGFRFMAILKGIKDNYGPVFCGVFTGLLCLGAHLKHDYNRGSSNFIAAVTGLFVAITGYICGEWFRFGEGEDFKILGIQILVFAVINMYSSRIGDFIHTKLIDPPPFMDQRYHLRRYEIITIVVLGTCCLLSVPYFANLDLFYTVMNATSFFRIFIWIFAISAFVLFVIYRHRLCESESVFVWFCASMEVFFTYTVLELLPTKGMANTIFYWIGFAVLAVIVMIYIRNTGNPGFAIFTAVMIVITLFIGAYACFYGKDVAAGTLGAGTRFWIVAPAFFVMGEAVIDTAREIIRL